MLMVCNPAGHEVSINGEEVFYVLSPLSGASERYLFLTGYRSCICTFMHDT